MLVHRDRYDEARRARPRRPAAYTLGDPFDAGTRLGPLVIGQPSASGCAATSRRAWPRAPGWSPAAPSARARDRATSSAPTVFADVDPDSTIAQEEIFGPVLSIIPLRRRRRGRCAIANDTPYGLAGGVWSADEERARGGRPPDAHRRRSTSTAARSTRSPRSAATSSPASAASSARTAWRSSCRPSPSSAEPHDRHAASASRPAPPWRAAAAGRGDRRSPGAGPGPGTGAARRRRRLPLRPVHVQRHAARRRSRWCSATRRPAGRRRGRRGRHAARRRRPCRAQLVARLPRPAGSARTASRGCAQTRRHRRRPRRARSSPTARRSTPALGVGALRRGGGGRRDAPSSRARRASRSTEAALLGCAVLTGFGAVRNTARVRPGESVASSASAGSGLSSLQAARVAGRRRRSSRSTSSPAKEELARRPAPPTSSSPATSCQARSAALTGGRGVDHAFECVGRPSPSGPPGRPPAAAAGHRRRHRRRKDDRCSFNALDIFHSARTLRSSVYGSSDPDRELPELAAAVLRRRARPVPLISHRIGLDEAPAAFDRMARGEGARSVVIFED